MREGVRPDYNTQFAFVNKVDSFYVNFLQKNSIKFDVYLSRQNQPVLLGRAEFSLRELVEAEGQVHESNYRTPTLDKFVEIYPVITSRENPQGIADNRARSLGKLKFKMRLRKPISEALRFYRDQNEIRNIERFTQMQ